MPLNKAQTKEATRAFARQVFVDANRTATSNTDDIEAAVTAIVAFIEGNTVAINNALPEPFKNTATTAEKRHLIGLVSARLAGLI